VTLDRSRLELVVTGDDRPVIWVGVRGRRRAARHSQASMHLAGGRRQHGGEGVSGDRPAAGKDRLVAGSLVRQVQTFDLRAPVADVVLVLIIAALPVAVVCLWLLTLLRDVVRRVVGR
jgi:hypothetical protein